MSWEPVDPDSTLPHGTYHLALTLVAIDLELLVETMGLTDDERFLLESAGLGETVDEGAGMTLDQLLDNIDDVLDEVRGDRG